MNTTSREAAPGSHAPSVGSRPGPYVNGLLTPQVRLRSSHRGVHTGTSGALLLGGVGSVDLAR